MFAISSASRAISLFVCALALVACGSSERPEQVQTQEEIMAEGMAAIRTAEAQAEVSRYSVDSRVAAYGESSVRPPERIVTAPYRGYPDEALSRDAPPVSYSTIGNTIYGSDGSTASTIGNTTYRSDGTTSTLIGNTTYRSDGTTSTAIGNTTYGSDGTTASTIGNTIYINGPNGTSRTCSNVGATTYCN